MTSTADLVPLKESLIDEAGHALARAFMDDPLCIHMFPDAEERARKTPCHFSGFLRYVHLFGKIWTTSGNPDASAAWLPPGQTEMTGDRVEASGLHLVPDMVGIEAWQRFLEVSDYIDRLHPDEAPEPHWYLPLIGVDTPRQGQGLGSALLRVVLDRADAERVPAYLWTVKAKNVAFYEHHGFRVLTAGTEPTSGVRFWTCRREASRKP